jgi:hypothetical protein
MASEEGTISGDWRQRARRSSAVGDTPTREQDDVVENSLTRPAEKRDKLTPDNGMNNEVCGAQRPEGPEHAGGY